MPEPRRTRSRSLRIKDTEIVDRVLRFFDLDDQARGAEKDARIQRYAKFRMWTEGKDWPWDDASDIALSDIMEKSLRVQDTLHNAVMSSRPVIGAKALDRADKQKEDTIDRLVDYQVFIEQNGEEVIGDIIDAFVNDGLYVTFQPWVKETREVSEAEIFDPIPDELLPVEYFEAIVRERFGGGVPVGDGWDWTVDETRVRFYTRPDKSVEMIRQQEIVVYDGPKIIQKEWDEVLYPSRAANLQIPGPSNPHGAGHVILVDYPSIDEVRRLQKSGRYDRLKKEDLDQLEVTTPSKSSNQEMRQQKDTVQGVEGDTESDRSKAPEQRTVTRLTCFDVYDLDGDDIAEDVVWVVIRESRSLAKASLLTELYPHNPPKRPLAHEAFIPVRGRVAGISLIEMMEGLHDALKMILDQTVDAGTLSNAPFGFYRPSGSMKPEIIRLSPGDLYPLQDPTRDVHFPNIQNQAQAFGINMITLLSRMEDQLTSQGPLQVGQVPQGKASALRTLGGMALIAGQGEARPERILRRFFCGLKEIWKQAHSLNQAFLPKEKQIRIIGLKDPSEDPFMTVSRSQIEGVFEFDFQANVFNTSKMALQQSLQTLMAAYVSEIALQLGIIDGEGIYRLLRDYGLAHGQDPDRYINAPSADVLKPRIFAEEAISQIFDGQVPDGVPAEPGGAIEHAEKLREFASSPEFGLLTPERVELFRGYLQQTFERAALQQRQQAAVQAAANFGQNGGSPGRPPENAPQDSGAPALQGGELMDESLPGAGGGANGGLQ